MNFIALQETQIEDVSSIYFKGFWGKSVFEVEVVPSIGKSGGLMSIWDPSCFQLVNSAKDMNFLLTLGRVKGCNQNINAINVYALQDRYKKEELWDKLESLKASFQGVWIFPGDLNSVREASERFNSTFCASSVDKFNNFINQAGLMECNMGGGRYTYMSSDGKG